MSEYFEITFFADKATTNPRKDKHWFLELLKVESEINQIPGHCFRLLEGRKVLFDIYRESDFIEYRIAIATMIITKQNFDDQLNQILEVVNACFNNVPSIIFATGIYEMTYYYIRKLKHISDFNEAIFSNFPFLFFRNGNKYGLKSSKQYGSISYTIHLDGNVQDIFATPTVL